MGNEIFKSLKNESLYMCFHIHSIDIYWAPVVTGATLAVHGAHIETGSVTEHFEVYISALAIGV